MPTFRELTKGQKLHTIGKMKIERISTYWKLFGASYNGHEVLFALTNQRQALPLLELSSEINSDFKIILMPREEGAPNPTAKEFEKMEEYFWNEGYMDYIERWYSWLNGRNFRFTDAAIENMVGKDSHRLMREWWKHDTLREFDKNDSK